ncbi:UvrD-helicase domain-containing protein, partial [Microgenomates group bacterium]|nr:UvrD-helicase domain-containing protein [Microgenomates group bacterium]
MKLNKAQQLAVDTTEGPVMVIAGPGTGKTQIIAERIANILQKTDTNPDSILALTFTESGAKAMRERLIATIGAAAYYVNISTFHAFCSQVIQEFPDRFSLAATEPLAELERVEIFHKIIDSQQFDYLKPANLPHYYTGALIKAIQDLNREAVTPPVLKEILKKTHPKTKEEKYLLAKNLELQQIYAHYQKALNDRGRYDFEDMINFVVEAFSRDESLLRTYQERLQYFLIDEYQDTNSSQNQVIDLLAGFWGQNANVFVVGDPNQCLPAGTKVITKNGSKNIETLKPGEEVLTAVGKGYTSFTKIKRVFKQKKKVKLITFTTKSGKKITTTDNHKMF